jgi:predicted dehydrogenase
MQNKKIRWGIVGTSPISKTMAVAIKESRLGQLAAVNSRSNARSEEFSQQFLVPKRYLDLNDLLNDDEVDAVYLGVPNHIHKEYIIKASKAKKHILCEKPFTISEAEAIEAANAVENEKVFCMEALMYRCHPFCQKILEVVQSGILGEIQLINAFYSADIVERANKTAGGSILNLGCYPVSLVRLLFGSEPVDIVAKGKVDNNHSDRLACGLFRFSPEGFAYIGCADDMPMSYEFTVFGTRGKMEAKTNPWMPKEVSFVTVECYKKAPQELRVVGDKSVYTYQIDSVNQSLLGNQRQGEVLLRDSIQNVAVLEKWLNQIRA